jgi:hypothetical protein
VQFYGNNAVKKTSVYKFTNLNTPQNNSASWDLQMGFNSAFKGLTNYLVDEVADGDFVGLRIRNTENVRDKVFGISFRRRDQLKPGVVWDYFPRFRVTLCLFD